MADLEEAREREEQARRALNDALEHPPVHLVRPLRERQLDRLRANLLAAIQARREAENDR